MNKLLPIGLTLTLTLFNVAARSIEPADQQNSIERKGLTMLDRWNEARLRAAIAIGAIKNPSSARRVEKNANPQIIIRDSSIFFDGKLLEFGRPLEFWKNIIIGKPRCDKTGIEWCVWEDLGLEVSANRNNSFGVSSINIKISIPEDGIDKKKYTDAERTHENSARSDWLAHHPFTGYLEIDGFGIDKETMFWELESNVDIRRNLSCGLGSCEFPRGIFGADSMIALHLNGNSESSTIEEITLYRISY